MGDGRQIELAERLQEQLLHRFETLIQEENDTPTDRATLARLLSQNGWSLDPSSLPQSLKDKVSKSVSPTADLDEGEYEV